MSARIVLKKFVVWFTLVCFIITTTGCAVNNGLMAGDRGYPSYNPNDQGNSSQAAQVFNSPPQVRSFMYDPSNRSQAQALRANFNEIKQKYKGRLVTTDAEKQEVAEAILPLTNYLYAVEQQKRGKLVVFPGMRRTLHFNAYCLDRTLGSPKQGEKMRLVPISTLFPPDVQVIYQRLLDYARNHPTEVTHNDMQGMTWAIREIVNQHNTQTFPLSEPQQQILEKASPGAVNVLRRYQQQAGAAAAANLQAQQATESAQRAATEAMGRIGLGGFGGAIGQVVQGNYGGAVGSALGQAANRAGINVGQQMGQYGAVFNGVFNVVAPEVAQNQVVVELMRLQNIPVTGTSSPNSEYTLLAPNVAARTLSVPRAGLGAQIEIVNNSGIPYGFSPTDYVGQSERQAQRLGLQPDNQGSIDPSDEELIKQILTDFWACLVNSITFGLYEDAYKNGVLGNIGFNDTPIDFSSNACTAGEIASLFVGGGIIGGIFKGLKGLRGAGAVGRAGATGAGKLLGKDFGKLGTVVNKPNIKVTDIDKHYLNRKLARGVTSSQVIDAIKNPIVVLQQKGGGHVFLTNNVAVVVNKAGKLVTTYGRGYFDDTIKEVLRQAQ